MIKSEEWIGAVAIVKISGGITKETTPELHKACERISRHAGMEGILLDLDEVTEIDTSAFACMIDFIKEHSADGIKVGIINPRRKEKAMMEIFRIGGIINTFNDKKQAVKKLLDERG